MSDFTHSRSAPEFAPELAKNKFQNGYCCSEAVLATFSEQTNINNDLTMKIGCALCGGLGGQGEICGALSAAIVVLGLKFGRTDINDKNSRAKLDAKTKAFLDEFKAKYEHVRCNDLVGFDRSTNEGHAEASASGVFKNKCPNIVRDAVLILEKILKS